MYYIKGIKELTIIEKLMTLLHDKYILLEDPAGFRLKKGDMVEGNGSLTYLIELVYENNTIANSRKEKDSTNRIDLELLNAINSYIRAHKDD